MISEDGILGQKKEVSLASCDGIHKLHVVIREPEHVKAVVQISHGMIEYVERYDGFAEFLNSCGFLVIGNDHLGHGQSVSSDEELGYFGEKSMSGEVVEDLHQVTMYAKEHYPNVPVFLFAHSMGSFLGRRYAMTYGNDVDGIILCGTGGQPDFVLKFGLLSATLIGKIKGMKHRSLFLKNAAFGQYNKRIPDKKTSNDWLTKDEQVVECYNKDKYCTFLFTVNGYITLFDTISYIQKKENIGRIPKGLPLFFIAGTEDPVGNYGKAVQSIYEQYRDLGIRDVAIRLYENDRHELINETDKQLVYEDVAEWLRGHLIHCEQNEVKDE